MLNTQLFYVVVKNVVKRLLHVNLVKKEKRYISDEYDEIYLLGKSTYYV